MLIFRVLAVTSLVALCWTAKFNIDDADSEHETVEIEDQNEAEKVDNDLAGSKASMKWRKIAQDELSKVLNVKKNTKKAKNVIFFLGDGMGPTSVTAARWYMAESQNKPMDKTAFAWENFEHTALSRTYNTDRMTPDSAGTATAYLCGVKTNLRVIGYNQNVKQYSCKNAKKENKVYSILHETKKASKKKWTGVVTVTRVTHATPAGTYAHTPGRNWEAFIPKDQEHRDQCKDIAWQLVNENNDIRVVMGGGHYNFLPKSKKGKRQDGEDLIEKWKKIQEAKTDKDRVHFVTTQDELSHVQPKNVDYLMGLFAQGHMNFEVDRLRDEKNTQPSLVEMTEKAINVLKQGEDGFFLLVEGGLIDHGHHANRAFAAFNDTVMFSQAVQKALDMTSREDTLVVVTADHSHTITMSGYPKIENGILGVVNENPSDYEALDKKPRLTINYANGPGFRKHRLDKDGKLQPRRDVSKDDTKSPDYLQDAAINRKSETHGGEDVGVYATGPMSHLFNGVHQQNYLMHAMAYASCVGDNLKHCENGGEGGKDDGKNSAGHLAASIVTVLVAGVVAMVMG